MKKKRTGLILSLTLAAMAFALAGPLFALGKQGAALMSPAEAKSIIDEGRPHVLLDVRTRDEHLDRRIPGSVLLPYTLITAESAARLIPAKDSLVIVYCRSGRRSAIAASSLRDLGYTLVFDLGGINDWPYPTLRGE